MPFRFRLVEQDFQGLRLKIIVSDLWKRTLITACYYVWGNTN